MANDVVVRNNDKKSGVIAGAIIAIVIGIMFCFSLFVTTKTLSIIFGIVFIVCGTTLVLITMINAKSLLSQNGIIGATFISFGILAIFQDIINVILSAIPWILIALGAIAIIDSFLLMFLRKEKHKVAQFILELVIGLIVLIAGFGIKFITSITRFAGIVFGASLIIYGIASIIAYVRKK